MDKLITLCEYLKIGIPAKSSILGHILDYFCNEVDSDPANIAAALEIRLEGENDSIEAFIEANYSDVVELTCELCGKPLYEQLWQDGRHIECSAAYADIEASGHGDW